MNLLFSKSSAFQQTLYFHYLLLKLYILLVELNRLLIEDIFIISTLSNNSILIEMFLFLNLNKTYLILDLVNTIKKKIFCILKRIIEIRDFQFKIINIKNLYYSFISVLNSFILLNFHLINLLHEIKNFVFIFRNLSFILFNLRVLFLK